MAVTEPAQSQSAQSSREQDLQNPGQVKDKERADTQSQAEDDEDIPGELVFLVIQENQIAEIEAFFLDKFFKVFRPRIVDRKQTQAGQKQGNAARPGQRPDERYKNQQEDAQSI